MRKVVFEKHLDYPDGIMMDFKTTDVKPEKFFRIFKSMETE